MTATTKSRKGQPAKPAPETEILAYKGFNPDWTCRAQQYAVGETYTHDGAVVACEAGFHACEYPLDVFGYYPPGTSRYAEVRQFGEIAKDGHDTKIASARLTVTVELSLHDMITRAVKWVFDRARSGDIERATGEHGAASNTGRHGAASNTGWQGAASNTGWHGAASNTGWQGAASNTGWHGAASNTGERGAASNTGRHGAASNTGEQGAASNTGEQGAASNTGWQGAASNTGWHGAASNTGRHGAASNTGWQGAASNTGEQGAASNTGRHGAASSTGEHGAAMAVGHDSRVMGAAGNALFLVYRDPGTGEILHAWAGIVGRDGIEPGIWYSLNAAGVPFAVKET